MDIVSVSTDKLQDAITPPRRVKYLLRSAIFSAIILCFLLLNTAVTSVHYSGIFFWNSSRNTGNKWRGEEVVCTYPLTNTTLQTIHVKLEPACGCVEAQISHDMIAPLSTVTLSLRVRTVDMEPGEQNQHIGMVLQSSRWTCQRDVTVRFHLK